MATDSQILQKVDFALSDLTTSGMLNPEQSSSFIRTLQEQPTIMKDARIITMDSPKKNIDKIKFGSRLLHAASQDPNAGDAVYTGAGRWLTPANRTKPTTSQVQLNVHEVIAEVRLNYESLEDNIEKANFSETLLALIAARAALDLEDLIITGDTGSGDAYLALFNGILVQSTSNVVDALGDSVSIDVMGSILKATPKAFRNLPGMRLYTTRNAEVDLRQNLASRNTPMGDAYAVGSAPLALLGKPIQGADRMTDNFGFYTDPKNIIVGFHRQVRMEMDRDIRSRELIFVITARVDMKLEEETAVVKVVNLAS
jgi:HK97 family phage major capsid protein